MSVRVSFAPTPAWLLGGTAILVAAASAVAAHVHAVEAPGATGWSGGVGVALLALGVVIGSPALIGPSTACMLAAWSLSFIGVADGVDPVALGAALSSFTVAELAAWSIDARTSELPARLVVGEVTAVAAVALGVVGIGGVLVVLLDDASAGGTTAATAGVLAAVSFAALAAALASIDRHADSSSR